MDTQSPYEPSRFERLQRQARECEKEAAELIQDGRLREAASLYMEARVLVAEALLSLKQEKAEERQQEQRRAALAQEREQDTQKC